MRWTSQRTALRTSVRTSLATRLVLTMLGVAAVALLIAALLTNPLVRSATESSARATLARQADLLASLARPQPVVNRLDLVGDERGLYLGSVNQRGRATGIARELPGADLRLLQSGAPVSTTFEHDGRSVLVEARPTRGGGAIVLATDADTVDRAVATQRRRLLLALSLGLLVAVAAGALLARQLGRPLARLAATARRMSAGERGAPPPDPGGTREVADVAAALQQLDGALQVSEARQRRFLLSVSHELRTPLTAIRGYAESLADGVVRPAELPAVAGTLVAESERMQRYVEDLLDLARLEADDFSLRPVAVDVVGLVRATVAAWRPRGERAGVTVLDESSSGRLVVETDPVRLRQVLDALLDNAVRVCPEGARVVLASYPLIAGAGAPSGARIEVRDSGPGLAAEDAEVAFSPGALHERYAERAGGLGLGLAIVHGLVTRLGGTVGVGRAPEGGAGFRIDLP